MIINFLEIKPTKTIIIENVTITTTNPTELLNALEEIANIY